MTGIRSSDVIEASLALAGLGIPIVPLCRPVSGSDPLRCSAHSKCPEKNIGKRPTGGDEWQIRATTDPAEIKRELSKPCNIGLLCGQRSGIIAIDIDPDHGGRDTFGQLEVDLGELPATWAQRTGSGGAHYLFSCPAGLTSGGAAGALGDGVDLRLNNNQIVVAPSLHKSGNFYSWLPGRAPGELPLASLPAAWLERVMPPKAPEASKVIRSVSGHAKYDDARVAYLNAHAREYPRQGSEPCPVCCEPGGCGCWGKGKVDGKWSCFNTDHPDGCGVRHLDHYTGDALDIDSALAGRSPTEHLRAEGYLVAATSQRPEPPPLEDGDCRERAHADFSEPKVVIAPVDRAPPCEEMHSVDVPEETGAPPKGRSYKADFDVHATDTGNSIRLAGLTHDDARFSVGTGWHVWDGRRWKSDINRYVVQLARRVADECRKEADEIDIRAGEEHDEEKRERLEAQAKCLRRWSLSSESKSSIESMIILAQTIPEMIVDVDAWDADPWFLNCLNGTVDLRDGTIREHRKSDLITKCCNAKYNPSARTEDVSNFIRDSTGGDPEFSACLQRSVGYSLTGETSEDKLFIVYGESGTGKTTLMDALKSMLGDYAKTADFQSFIKKDRGSGPRDDLADLYGSRMVLSAEVDKGESLAEGVVKMITGGDNVKARHLYQKLFEFRPKFKLWLICNDRPRVRSDDTGMWRRMVVMPFSHKPTVPDMTLKSRLRDMSVNRDALLAWAVQGCQSWLTHGVGNPDVVKSAINEYRDENDPLADFIRDCCVSNPDINTPVSTVNDIYDRWCRENRISKPLRKSFAKHMELRGFIRRADYLSGVKTKVYVGVCVSM